jgi:hypothetical protein
MDRRLVPLLTLLLTVCTPLADSAGSPPPGTSASALSSSVAGPAGCPVTAPVTEEHPKNPNTASFSRGWYVSVDRLLWASASGRFFVGGSKVLWERPGTFVAISGKLLDGDTKAAGVPTITGPQGYEGSDYQASGVTFPVAGCWEVEARAGNSVLDFVTLVYPRDYAPAPKSCVDLKGTFDNSDAVLQASAIAVGTDLPGFASLRLSPKIVYKAPAGFAGYVDLHIDLAEEETPRSGDGYTLFLARSADGAWQIVCPFRTLATVDGAGTIHLVTLHRTAPLLPNDVRELDQQLRTLAQ